MDSVRSQSQPVGKGDEVIRLVAELPRYIPQLRTLTFTSYRPRVGADERLSQRADAQTKVVLDAIATALRASGQALHGIHEVAWSYLAKDNVATILSELIPLATAKEEPPKVVVEIDHLDDAWLRRFINELPSGTALAICSQCTLSDGSARHIPMMDFRSLLSSDNELFIVDAMRGLGQPTGFVVESGNSYHFYGTNPLDQAAWQNFMATALLLAPFTDVRYIGHRLRAGMCTLRINSTSVKPAIPIIARSFGIES